MMNYNSRIIIYALLLDKKKSSSGPKLSARLLSNYTPQGAVISDDIVRGERLYEKCTKTKV